MKPEYTYDEGQPLAWDQTKEGDRIVTNRPQNPEARKEAIAAAAAAGSPSNIATA